MRSPSYILKNNYHERNLTRGFEHHVKKLEEISYQPPQLLAKQKSFQVTRQLDVRNKNQQLASKFNEMETVLERNRENESLIEKIKVMQSTKALSHKTAYSSKSLIQECKRKEENRIILENFNLAKRMINLPPVISNKKLDQEYLQHKHDLNLIRRYHSQRPPAQSNSKYASLQVQLNQLTKSRFQRTKSASNIVYIHNQLKAHQLLCLIDFKSVKLSSGNPCMHNLKNPSQYYWEVQYNQKAIFHSSSKDFEEAAIELLDFLIPTGASLTLILYKLKHNDEVLFCVCMSQIYVGQVEIHATDVVDPFDEITTVMESTLIIKPVLKQIEDKQTQIGQAQFKVITVRSLKSLHQQINAFDKPLNETLTPIKLEPSTDPQEQTEELVEPSDLKKLLSTKMSTHSSLMEYLFGTNVINQFVNTIIRPPRADDYLDEDLGPQVQEFKQAKVFREDFRIPNQLNQTLWTSLYTPTSGAKHCVVYLHGNGGSRLDGSTLLPLICQNGMALCVFDFSGSGKSGGMQESEDLEVILKHLSNRFVTFTLWGRSMGAATALIYQNRNNNPVITSLVVDSSFSSLKAVIHQDSDKQVCLDLYNSKYNLPNFIFDLILPSVEKKVQQALNTNPFNTNLTQLKCNTPALFIHSTDDKLVMPYHSDLIMKGYKGECHLIKAKGGHNATRNHECLLKCLNFILNHSLTPPPYASNRQLYENVNRVPALSYRSEIQTPKKEDSFQQFTKENQNPKRGPHHQKPLIYSRALVAKRGDLQKIYY